MTSKVSKTCFSSLTAQYLSCAPGSHSVCAIRTPLGVDWKILSIRKEPMLSGLLTLNAEHSWVVAGCATEAFSSTYRGVRGLVVVRLLWLSGGAMVPLAGVVLSSTPGDCWLFLKIVYSSARQDALSRYMVILRFFVYSLSFIMCFWHQTVHTWVLCSTCLAMFLVRSKCAQIHVLPTTICSNPCTIATFKAGSQQLLAVQMEPVQ